MIYRHIMKIVQNIHNTLHPFSLLLSSHIIRVHLSKSTLKKLALAYKYLLHSRLYLNFAFLSPFIFSSVPGSSTGYHIAFSQYVSPVSSGLCQFLSLSLFFCDLDRLNSGQVSCGMAPNLQLSDFFFFF